MTTGFVYYTHGVGDPRLLRAVRDQLDRATAIPAVAVSLAPIDWERPTVRAELPNTKPGYLTMFRQILWGLELLRTDVAFLCEHDVLYHPTHFVWTPDREDTFYYNQHTWRVNAATGQAVFYYCNQVSGLCASRALLIEHYRRVVAHVEAHGFDRALGFEPGGNRRQQTLHPVPIVPWMSEGCNVDIKSDTCLTKWRGSPAQFRNKATCHGWRAADTVPGWGRSAGRFAEWLDEVA